MIMVEPIIVSEMFHDNLYLFQTLTLQFSFRLMQDDEKIAFLHPPFLKLSYK